jgi:GMP reductase
MIIKDDIKLDFKDVLLEPKISSLSSRKQVSLVTQQLTLHAKKTIRGVPVISANMSSVSTFSMAEALLNHDMFCALHKHYNVEDLVTFFKSQEEDELDTHVFYTLGMSDHDLSKFQDFQRLYGTPYLICIDVANGYMTEFHKFIAKIRTLARGSIIMAGNVVTPEGAKALLNYGADIVKVGIGSSAVCRTRTVAGVGIPQFSAIIETIDAVNGMGGLLCSDGGCNVPSDFSKAFAAGAHFVMSGTMFAGHDECGGHIINGKMEFYGMSSETAMDNFHGGMAKYRASEGIRTLVDYKGSVSNTIEKITGGLRSTGTYINAKSLSEFNKNATFIKANRTHNTLFGD